VDDGIHIVQECKCENLVCYIVCQLLTLVLEFAVHPLVLALNVSEVVGVSATSPAQRPKTVVQAGSFVVESSHLLTGSELDELWRRQLFAVVSDHHGSHVFSQSGVECQYAVNVVSRLCVFDFDGEGQYD
jgi:hypothetical protein